MKITALLLLAATSAPLASAQGTPQPRQYAIECAKHYAMVYRVPSELVEAVIDVESNWNPNAVSPKGAVGLMQLMAPTAAALGVGNRFRIEDNVRGGVEYLASLIQFFKGDLRLAIGAYVAGKERIAPCGLKFSSPEVYEYVSQVARDYRRRRAAMMNGETR